jgi:hypothetical protein
MTLDFYHSHHQSIIARLALRSPNPQNRRLQVM